MECTSDDSIGDVLSVSNIMIIKEQICTLFNIFQKEPMQLENGSYRHSKRSETLGFAVSSFYFKKNNGSGKDVPHRKQIADAAHLVLIQEDGENS